jgi:ornithine--oxo-acid transaminase
MNYIETEEKYGAHHYHPLPVVLTEGKGVYVWDCEGNQYLDMMSAYSAVSLGHSHPVLVQALSDQAGRLAIVSRAYYTDKLAPFLKKMCEVTDFERALPMNTGAEAVETAMKAARKWGEKVKGIPKNRAEIIACEGNFHGRTIAIVGMSTESQYQDGFGPFPEGLKTIPFADSQALEKAITPNTAAFIVEPIQGEAGIVIPPENYLKACAEICKKHNVLLIFDEIQSGLGRTGELFAFQHENVQPDGLILGKALGGGLLAVSMFLSNNEVMDVFTAGDHGSTFGGNPLSAVIGLEAINLIIHEKLSENSGLLGNYFLSELKKIDHPAIVDIRGKGLFIAIELDLKQLKARDICLALMKKGLLSKETHATVVRLAPPLIITKEQIDEALDKIKEVFRQA